MKKLIWFALATAGCSTYGQQSASGSRYATSALAFSSSGASEYLTASAGAEATVRDAEGRGALAFASADERQRQSVAYFHERMSLADRLATCNKLLAGADEYTRRQHEACTAAANQAHAREILDRNGYPPFMGYGYGYGYGYMPGVSDILLPGALAGAFGAHFASPQPGAAATDKTVKADLRAVKERQRALETNIDALAVSARDKKPSAAPATGKK
ncbi:hypothetical protein EPN90_02435 [Patescibacteria group bacterium]|nr:MAG: hypothetical protein EPN90_02435 [Patescibacteria group bacterium]